MTQKIYGWKYSDGSIDCHFIEYFPDTVWRRRWKEMGQYEALDAWHMYKDFDHWVEWMIKEGEGVVEVQIEAVGGNPEVKDG